MRNLCHVRTGCSLTEIAMISLAGCTYVARTPNNGVQPNSEFKIWRNSGSASCLVSVVKWSDVESGMFEYRPVGGAREFSPSEK
jgi:hypothetical protein